jgi:predicted alpha-1,6-mannanase (GH76 family)
VLRWRRQAPWLSETCRNWSFTVLMLGALFLPLCSELANPAEASTDSTHPTLPASESFAFAELVFAVFTEMLSFKTLAGLVAHTAQLLSSHLQGPAGAKPYIQEARRAIEVLQNTWYNSSTGLWESTGWWNSANCLTVLVDSGIIDVINGQYVADIVNNTFYQAQQVDAQVVKTTQTNGLVQSNYSKLLGGSGQARSPGERDRTRMRGAPNFRNNYYDDEGWWLWAFLRAFDLTSDTKYLTMAEDIFADMLAGTDDFCGGGIWWSKDRTYKNAIANELFLLAAVGLANRVGSGFGKHTYLRIALQQWEWFKHSGLINSAGTINDGLTSDCRNNRRPVYTYNQGVILLGLVELARATDDTSHLDQAAGIAHAAIRDLTDAHGILHEPCEPNCGADGSQFKGIFLRGLSALQGVAPRAEIADFIAANAKSVLGADTDSLGRFGLVWSGPAVTGGEPNASTHSSALEALLAAVVLFE